MSTSHVAILLDKSGSMASLREATVSMYNEQVQQLQINAREGEEIKVSLLTFNGGVYEHLWEVPADQLELASVEGYQPEGSTNIWDAMGYTIRKWSTDTDAESADNTYLMILISDGEHMHSGQVQWTAERLQQHIQELQTTKRWTFTFLGCSSAILDRFSQQTGIPKDNMGVWSARSASAAVATANAPAAQALAAYFSDNKKCSNYYSPEAGVAMNFAGDYEQNLGVPTAGTTGTVLRSAAPTRKGPGGSSVRTLTSSFSPDVAECFSFNPESVQVGSAQAASVDAPAPEPPKYTLGNANVFGTSRKV